MANIIISIISIVSGFIIVFINEILTHNRDKIHRKNELLLSHLKDTLEWLNTMQKDIFEVSRMLDTLICNRSDIDRSKELRMSFSAETNRIVEKSIVFCDSYADMNNSLGIDLDLKEFNKSISQYISELRQIQKSNISPDEDLDVINKHTNIITEEIKKRIDIIINEINKLLLK